MGQWSKSFPYPGSSRQSPSASNTWPLTPSPTGTEIESPVSVTSTPRTSPSVGSSEIVRTRLSPRCCATSSVSVFASASNVTSACSALNRSGTEPRGNSTSTTGPVIRTTRPLVSVPLAFFEFSVCLVVVAISSSLPNGAYLAASASAFAPPTISLISWVIWACRSRLASSVSALMRSSALSLADFIARWREASSDAADSSNAAYTRVAWYRGNSTTNSVVASGSNEYNVCGPLSSSTYSTTIGAIRCASADCDIIDLNSV